MLSSASGRYSEIRRGSPARGQLIVTLCCQKNRATSSTGEVPGSADVRLAATRLSSTGGGTAHTWFRLKQFLL